MRTEDMIVEAIKNGDIIRVLKGENGLSVGFDQMVGAVAPTDWTKVLPIIYKMTESEGTEVILQEFEKGIKALLAGSAEEVYVGVSVFYIQLIKEQRGGSPFAVERVGLAREASKGIAAQEKGLKKSKAWGGEYNEEGLWTEIERYRKLMSDKFNIQL